MFTGFSILIPTWNNLSFLKLCVESIRENSSLEHQIIVHINDGSDGTLEWVKAEGIDYTYTPQNVGVCLAMNMMRTKVATDYMYFVNDDMYVLPGWDTALMDEIKRLGHNRFFLSSTMIQPHDKNDIGLCVDYGDTIEGFQKEELLKHYMDIPYPDWQGATRPPNMVHRDIWDMVGGYSIELSPGMYSDPDFTAKLLLIGITHLKGIGHSRVYHFETKTTQRVKKNDGRLQFLLKWGITNSSMRKYITRQGEDWAQKETPLDLQFLRKKRIMSRLKAAYYLLTKGFGIIHHIENQKSWI